MTLTDVSCLIRLHRSAPLLDLVCGNVDEHVAQGTAVLCSDQHGLYEAADRIVERYRDEPLVTVLRSTAGGNWMSNVNVLISHASMDFFRIIPHDDSVEAASTGWLAETLRMRPVAVLCHGYVRAEALHGERLPDRDEPNFPLRPRAGRDQFSMGLFWQGLFNGAFKALIRRQCLPSGPLLIRPTRDLVHAERAWLFELSLIGEFLFDERANDAEALPDGERHRSVDARCVTCDEYRARHGVVCRRSGHRRRPAKAAVVQHLLQRAGAVTLAGWFRHVTTGVRRVDAHRWSSGRVADVIAQGG